MGKRLLEVFDTGILGGLVSPHFAFDGVLWGVGVSGGSDSVALLTALVKAGHGDSLVALHMNHGWGAEDDAAEAFVDDLCDELGVSLIVGSGDGLEGRGSEEANARLLRMQFYKEQAEALGLAGVMLGHQADDMVEHVLMRLARGSGLQGLVGLAAVSEIDGLKLVRPLLGVRKEALRDYLVKEHIGWQDDARLPDGGMRVRLRQVLPGLMDAGMDVEALLGSVEALRDADEVVEAVVAEVLAQVVDGEKGLTLPCPVLLAAGREVGVRVLGTLIARRMGRGEVIRRGKRVALWERIGREEVGVGELGGARFEWREGMLRCVPGTCQTP